MNGIEPSTSCLQSTLSIVQRDVQNVDACSLVTARSLCFRSSAGLKRPTWTRSYAHVPISIRLPTVTRVGTGGYVRGYVELSL